MSDTVVSTPVRQAVLLSDALSTLFACPLIYTDEALELFKEMLRKDVKPATDPQRRLALAVFDCVTHEQERRKAHNAVR